MWEEWDDMTNDGEDYSSFWGCFCLVEEIKREKDRERGRDKCTQNNINASRFFDLHIHSFVRSNRAVATGQCNGRPNKMDGDCAVPRSVHRPSSGGLWVMSFIWNLLHMTMMADDYDERLKI